MAKRNRSHHKVESLTCRQMIDRMLADGHTYEAIQQAVREAGESIGKASLSRYHNKYTAIAEKVTQTREAMQTLIDATRDRPNTDLAEAISDIAKQGLADRIASAIMTGAEFEEMSVEKAIKALADLQRSDVARERLKLQFNKGVEAAVAVLDARVKELLGSQYPDLAIRMQQVIHEVELAAKAQGDK